MNVHFLIINYDYYTVGLASAFVETYLEFETLDEARKIALHWDRWIDGEI